MIRNYRSNRKEHSNGSSEVPLHSTYELSDEPIKNGELTTHDEYEDDVL